jgi:hypothetical protein
VSGRLAVIILITATQTVAFFTVPSLPPFRVEPTAHWWLSLPVIALGVVAFGEGVVGALV